MTQYTWPSSRDWLPNRFRMRVVPNERMFPGYYSGQTQAIDLLGERWEVQMVLPSRRSLSLGALREVWMERLRQANTLLLWNLRRPQPVGTMRGSPTVRNNAAQLASTIDIQTTAGATLNPGDMIGFNGQLSRVMGTSAWTADGSGHMDGVSIWPRVRSAVTAGAAVTWDAPTAAFRMADPGGVPVEWMPGGITDALSLRLIEA